ncbi:hypothetical protein ACEQ8H_001148 [Pleosporales sp. CAS-2024a]
MPALRKSTRAPPHNRSSTTPYASPARTPSENPGGKRQSLMTEWAEPVPQNLAPSFEEHGFARHGVLETMAPLGVPPSARVKQKTRAMGETAARNVAFGKGSAVYSDGPESTPELTPAPELDADDSERPEDDMMPVEFPLHEEDEDDDYRPNKATKKKAKVAKTPIRGKTPVQAKTPVHGKTPSRNGTCKSESVSASPAVQAVQPLPLPPSQQTDSEQRMQTAVNDAILRANKAERWQIGIAFKELWAECERNPIMLEAMEAIARENHTDEQWQVFRAHMKASRKRQRNAAKLKRLQDESGGRRAAGVYATSLHSPRASSEVIPDDSASVADDGVDQDYSTHVTPGGGPSANDNAHRALQISIEHDSALAPPHPFKAAPAIPPHAPSEPAPRMLSKSPRKRTATHRHLAPDVDMDMDGRHSTTAPTPAGKTPESGGDSDSELSEVNEEIVQKGPPEPVQANGKPQSAAAAAAAKKVLSAAKARAAKKQKPNAGKLFGKHATTKHPQQTPEQVAEEDRACETRKELVKQQATRQFELNDFPVSDVRFDDEINDTESLTESQIAVGPPVGSDQPRRAGRVPHHNAKRIRDDGHRFSSPLAESTAGTRPSTPAVGPATKRIKLTHGSTARTKRSPVKNRDGPIAGVAYVNGGASKQLGPDDNDPNSLSSESDDFCSACKGAGEFVCCETCPRVFHLLCCDPPRAEVPDDAFFCYECRPKGTAEESADSLVSLGPLLKSLDRINPRAFALPSEIQTEFEGISAKADGSYFEEVKKFPLAKNSGYGYQKPDYTRMFDGDGKAVLCTQCGLSSGGKRQLLKCDYCPAHWHLDCLDPPLANPPHISVDSSQRDAWRCPRHIEHDLRSGQLYQNDLNDMGHAEMPDAAPAARVARKIRKRKQPMVVEPTFSRGMRNNGLIEIINDSDDETDGEGNYVFARDDPKDLNAKIFRVPEKGVILDFLSKVKSGHVSKHTDASTNATAATGTQHKATMQNFVARPMAQQQAALHLARLANKEQDIGLSEGRMDLLLLTLTAEANNDVTTALDRAGPPPLDDNERAQLLKLQELIARRLKG